MPCTGHTAVDQGSQAIVHMKDGSKIVGRFRKQFGHRVYLDGHNPIHVRLIRCVGYFRPKTEYLDLSGMKE